MTKAIPAKRIQLAELAPNPSAAMLRLEQSIELDRSFGELVAIRTSRINGCAFCADMRWKVARSAGLSEERLYSLRGRESPLYDERQRAALAPCEAITSIANAQVVPDPDLERARAAFSECELAHPVFAITAINGWNRVPITAGAEPGHYGPSMKLAA